MSILDARTAGTAFHMSDAGLARFGSYLSNTSTTYTWLNAIGDSLTAIGSSITVSPNGKPYSNARATSLNFDLDADGTNDVRAWNFNAPLATMLVSEVSFWDQLLRGNDTIYAPVNFSATIFGDQFSVERRNVVGGNDTLVGGENSQTLVGDALLVSAEFSGSALLTGGDDILNAIAGDSTKTLIGDADYVIEATVIGGQDRISGSPGDDTIVGDVRTLGDSTFSGGNDALYGRDGNDTLVGDIDAIGSGNFLGSDATGGDDLVRGGDGNDVLYGDFRSIYDIVSSTVSGGNDRLYGDGGDDAIYGDSAVAPASPVAYTFGHDRIWGGEGNDDIHGDTADTLHVVGGNDVLYGDDGNDNLYGGGGHDRMFGGEGMDFLVGGSGDDQLTGGFGSDTFHFDLASGQDEIVDFVDDADTVQISSSYGFATPQDVVNAAAVVGDSIYLLLSPSDEVLLLHAGTDATIVLNDIVIA